MYCLLANPAIEILAYYITQSCIITHLPIIDPSTWRHYLMKLIRLWHKLILSECVLNFRQFSIFNRSQLIAAGRLQNSDDPSFITGEFSYTNIFNATYGDVVQILWYILNKKSSINLFWMSNWPIWIFFSSLRQIKLVLWDSG